MKNDHGSKFSNLSNWKEKAWKNQGFNGIRTRDVRDTGAMLYQLSYEATHWERDQFVEFISPVRSEMAWSIYGSVRIISRLDSQSMFQMFTLFGPPTWRLHTRLYNFARNILTNISTLGQRTHRKLRELCPLFIVYNITISWPYPRHGFWFFWLRDNVHTLLNPLSLSNILHIPPTNNTTGESEEDLQ